MMYLHNNKRWGIIFIDYLMSWGLDISASWRLASKRWSAQCWLPELYDQPTHPFVDSSDEYLEQDGRMRVPLKQTDVEGGKKRNKHLPESKRSGYWTKDCTTTLLNLIQPIAILLEKILMLGKIKGRRRRARQRMRRLDGIIDSTTMSLSKL